MGLCKCRVVSNLFCFEHRKNVCENCLISDHNRCIIKSYLLWLEDSDFVTDCSLCKKSLKEGDVVRLQCYDLFHWSCLDRYGLSFPPETAPAGFSCPVCEGPLIPQDNCHSPVANELRQRLASASWANTGLPHFPALQTTQNSQVYSQDEQKKNISSESLSQNRPTYPAAEQTFSSVNSSRKFMDARVENSPHRAIPIRDMDDDKYRQKANIRNLIKKYLG
eukprot:Sdes_comp17189_c0_seq1m6363